MSTTWIVAIVIASLIVIGLSFYAGKLLYQLRAQTARQNRVRRERIEVITESIQTIAMAVEQQQCNLSEGAIRLIRLIEGLPVENVPDCSSTYPALYELYGHVRDLPTHEERKKLKRNEREQQDQLREEHESRLESKILQEVAQLKSFNI